MSGRASGSAQKRQFKPNLANANKREIKQETGSPARQSTPSTSRGRSGTPRGRGARGSGRGRGGASTIVESTGVFSHGPAAKVETQRATAYEPYDRISNNRMSAGASNGKINSGDKNDDNLRRRRVIDSESPDVDKHIKMELDVDGDDDEIALAQLLTHDFINDRRDDQRVVQPRTITVGSSNTESPTTTAKNKQTQKRKRIVSDSSDSNDADSHDATEPLSVAQCLKKAKQYNRDPAQPGRYIYMHFPVGFNKMIFGAPDDALDKSLDVTEASTSATTSTGANQSANEPTDDKDDFSDVLPTTKHCLDSLSNNTKIGKIQLLKSGKARLVVGRQRYPLEMATDICCKQKIIQLDLPDESNETGNLNVLGDVAHRMTIRVDAEQLVHDYNELRAD